MIWDNLQGCFSPEKIFTIFRNFYRLFEAHKIQQKSRNIGLITPFTAFRFNMWKKYLSFLNPCTLLMQLRKDELCTWESYSLFCVDFTIQNISFLNCIGTTKTLRKEQYFSNIHKNKMKAALTHSLWYFFDNKSGIHKGLNHLEKMSF